MSAASIGGIGSASQIAGQSSAFADISSDEFVKIMISELSNQDPLKPQDSAALLDQLSNLRNIESQLNLQDSLESLVLQNQIASAGGMIGKAVDGLDANNNKVNGLVKSVRVEADKVILELDTGKSLPMDRVMQISQLEASQAAI
jgi:flagellar basal-body rod modification protein FlgD